MKIVNCSVLKIEWRGWSCVGRGLWHIGPTPLSHALFYTTLSSHYSGVLRGVCSKYVHGLVVDFKNPAREREGIEIIRILGNTKPLLIMAYKIVQVILRNVNTKISQARSYKT